MSSAELEIRPFRNADGPRVRELVIAVNRLLSPSNLRDAFEAYIERTLADEIDRIEAYYSEHGGGFWVATLRGGLVGTFGLERASADAMELRRMYVDPAARRVGTGRRMLQHAEAECRRRGVKRLELSTAKIQTEAIALYRSAGYRLVREELAEHSSNKTVGSGIRRLYFEKTLSEAGLDNLSDTCSAQFLTVRDRATPGERISAIDCATADLTRSTAMFKLFYSPGSCALASHIALEEVGAAYTAARIDFSKSEQRSPEYLAINPKGRVPALATDDGILTETPAILAFIAQSFPQAKLAPLDDPFAFARIQAFNSYLCSTVHVVHAHRMRGTRWADDPAAIEAMRRKVPASVAAAFALIEDGMLEGPWVMGERYTICDPYLFTLAEWLDGDGVDLAKLPRVIEHRTRMYERPAVKQAIAQERG